LRVLLCDRAFEIGLEVSPLLALAEAAPALGAMIDAEHPERLAQLRLMWSLRPLRPWDRIGPASNVFEWATVPASEGVLEMCPDLLLIQEENTYQAAALNTQQEPRPVQLLVCGRGVVLQGVLFTSAPLTIEIVRLGVLFRAGHQLTLDDQRFQFSRDPEPVVHRLEKWCKYLWSEFLPQTGPGGELAIADGQAVAPPVGGGAVPALQRAAVVAAGPGSGRGSPDSCDRIILLFGERHVVSLVWPAVDVDRGPRRRGRFPRRHRSVLPAYRGILLTDLGFRWLGNVVPWREDDDDSWAFSCARGSQIYSLPTWIFGVVAIVGGLGVLGYRQMEAGKLGGALTQGTTQTTPATTTTPTTTKSPPGVVEIKIEPVNPLDGEHFLVTVVNNSGVKVGAVEQEIRLEMVESVTVLKTPVPDLEVGVKQETSISGYGKPPRIRVIIKGTDHNSRTINVEREWKRTP